MPVSSYTRPPVPSVHLPVARPSRFYANQLGSERPRQLIAFLLPTIATCYSALLAIMVARGFPINTTIVVLIELALLATAGIYCLRSGLQSADGGPILLMFGFVVTAILTTMVVGRPMVETLRSAAIIGLFTMVGYRATFKTLDRVFLLLFAIVLSVLFLEVFWLQGYVNVFHPSAFYAATRGIEEAEYNNTGLFNTATSYQSRFNFGIFNIPRTSSIFLEQVSNGNFAAISAMYLSVRGRSIQRLHLLLGLVTVVMVLITTNARFDSLLVLATVLGYYVFPYLSRITLPMATVFLFLGALIVASHNIEAGGDDLQGRISFVARKFRDYDASFYLGLDAGSAVRERDSGYSFFIGTTSIFGMIGLWIYGNFLPRMDDGPSRRLAWELILYFFGQLVVSSTSLLTMKTAALLWFMVGCVRANGTDLERKSS